MSDNNVDEMHTKRGFDSEHKEEMDINDGNHVQKQENANSDDQNTVEKRGDKHIVEISDEENLSPKNNDHVVEQINCSECDFKAWTNEQLTNHVLWHKISELGLLQKLRDRERTPFICLFCPCSMKTLNEFRFHLQFHQKDIYVNYFLCSRQAHFRTNCKGCIETNVCTSIKVDASQKHKFQKKYFKSEFHKDQYKCIFCEEKPFELVGNVLNHQEIWHRIMLERIRTDFFPKFYDWVISDFNVAAYLRGSRNNGETAKDHDDVTDHVLIDEFMTEHDPAQKRDLDSDVEMEAPKPPLLCTLCGKTFNDRSNFRIHVMAHLEYKPFRCTVCSYKGADAGNLNFHKKSKHRNNPAARYTIHANSKMDNIIEQALKKRVFKVDEDEKQPKFNYKVKITSPSGHGKLRCTICDRLLVQKNALERHILSHYDVKQYICSSCERAFRDRRVCRLHCETVHNGNADILFKNYPEIRAKVKEMANGIYRSAQKEGHTSAYRYFCSRCPKQYYTLMNLRDHVRGHYNHKPYTCSLCDYTAVNHTFIKHHLRSMHPNNPLGKTGKRPKTEVDVAIERDLRGKCTRVLTSRLDCDPTLNEESAKEIRKKKRYGDVKEKAKLRTRLKNCRTGTGLWKCDICPNHLIYKRIHLEEHLWMHEENQPFLCAECGYNSLEQTPENAECDSNSVEQTPDNTLHHDKKSMAIDNSFIYYG